MIYRSGRGCSIAAYLSAGKEFNEAIFSNEMKKRFDIIFLELWYEINSRLYLKCGSRSRSQRDGLDPPMLSRSVDIDAS